MAAADLAVWGHATDAQSGPQILLADGSLIRADVLKLDERSLVVGDASGLGRMLWDESTLPRAAALAIAFRPPAAAADRDALLDRLVAHEGTDDLLLLDGGESLAGSLVSAPLDGRFLPADADPNKGVFQLARRGVAEPIDVPAAKVVALALAAGAAPAKPVGMSAWIGSRDGSLVQATSIEVHGGLVTLHLAAGGALITTLAGRDDPDLKFWDEVKLLQPVSNNVLWLSDLKTLGYKHIPFLSVQWPYRNDRSVTGPRLRSGGELFRKGLGMHSASRLAFDAAGYRKFEAELALDDTAGRRGSVIFKVLLQHPVGNALRGVPEAPARAEWTTAYESPVIRGGEAPIPISIDLSGATRLALLIEFADRGAELDHANWLNARLVK